MNSAHRKGVRRIYERIFGHQKESVSFTPHIITPVLSIDRLYTALVATYPNDFYYHGESHDMWEISCILSGAAGFTSGTHVYECLQGDAVITPGGLFHSAWAMNNESIHLMTISFSGEWLNRFVPSGKHTLADNEKTLYMFWLIKSRNVSPTASLTLSTSLRKMNK